MKRIYVLFMMMFALSSCVSVEFVRKDFTPHKQAVLRYQTPSNPSKDSKYRDEINKQATSFCNGAFDVTKEYQARGNTGTSTGIGTGFGVGMGGILLGTSNQNTAMYNFVELSCK